MLQENSLLVPLRSNASALLAGRPVEGVRRRLKAASLYFDHLYLEGGTWRLSAGPGGSWGVHEPPSEGKLPRWQTPASRGADRRRPFSVAIGRESTPGIPAEQMQSAIRSDTSVSWAATLDPFEAELPAGTDWISFTPTRDPDGEAGRVSNRWGWADDRNAALEKAIPERFVRSAVIKNANRDLGFAVQYGVALAADPLHSQVITQRFRDDNGWKFQGFVVPILFPDVGDWAWEDVADLRRDKHMSRFRAILREVEQEAVAEASDGDVEAAVQRVYRRHLVEAQGAMDSVGTGAHTMLQGFVIGGILGFATTGLTGPLGIVADAAIGAVPGTIMNIRDIIERRKSRGWTILQQRIDSRFAAGS